MTKPEYIPPNAHVAVYALVKLGGAERPVHSEHVAAKCFDLDPSRFAWRLEVYRAKGWPDKNVVRMALEDAKGKKYGALVEGSYALELAKDGWRVTPAGVRWFKENAKRVESALRQHGSRASVPLLEKQRFVKKINGELLYKKFLKQGVLSYDDIYRFTDMLNCSPDVSQDVVAMKFDLLNSTAELVNDPNIIRFLDTCRDTFFNSNGTFKPKAAVKNYGCDPKTES